DVFSAPYQGSVDCLSLNLDWNQVDVTAFDAAGNSASEYFWLFRDHKPTSPSSLDGQAISCSQILLTWSDTSDNEEGFNVYRDGAVVAQVGADTPAYQDDGLSESTSYSYTVTSFLGTLESDHSNAVTISTPTCQPAPLNDDFGAAIPVPAQAKFR